MLLQMFWTGLKTDNNENSELETNRFSDGSGDSGEERDNIQSEQEEEIEEPSCHVTKKILQAAG